jgi:hypothetical protein
VVGTAEADAPPASEKVKPTAPNAGTAALVTRFVFEACLTRAIVASSIHRISSPEQRDCTRGKGAMQVCRIHDGAMHCSVSIHLDERLSAFSVQVFMTKLSGAARLYSKHPSVERRNRWPIITDVSSGTSC